MNYWDLSRIIKQFDAVVEDIDFAHLPEKGGEEYRILLLNTANDVIFPEGRYSLITEYVLEMFDDDEIQATICDLAQISSLTDSQRVRFGFYMDLKDLCYPLFRGREIDWSAYPWNMKSGVTSLDNRDLFDFITECKWPYVSAAIIYDLYQWIWHKDGFFSSLAKNESTHIYQYEVGYRWNRDSAKEQAKKELTAGINEAANSYWFIENHMHVGRQLGFDYVDQSVYDALDTFVDRTYRHTQVDCAKELGAWIKENMEFGVPYPKKEKIDALYEKMKELMAKYEVFSPNFSYTFNLITLDLLGMTLIPEDYDPKDDDNDLWDDDNDFWDDDDDLCDDDSVCEDDKTE